MKAVVLFSGGLDSTTVLALAKSQGYDVHALTVNYGQRHNTEVLAAQRIAFDMGVTHVISHVGLRAWGGSALTDDDIEVPEEETEGIPATYVPARNTVLLAMGLSYAEAIGAHKLFIGVSSVDFSGYPDCRSAFIEAFNRVATVGLREVIGIEAPLVHMSKADTIRLGRSLGVDYGRTWSCYQPTKKGLPCGKCDSCRIRAAAFAEVDVAVLPG